MTSTNSILAQINIQSSKSNTSSKLGMQAWFVLVFVTLELERVLKLEFSKLSAWSLGPPQLEARGGCNRA